MYMTFNNLCGSQKDRACPKLTVNYRRMDKQNTDRYVRIHAQMRSYRYKS